MVARSGDFTLGSFTKTTRAVSGSAVNSTVRDENITTTTGAGTIEDVTIPYNFPGAPVTVTRTSLAPSVATPDATNPFLWAGVSAGSVTLRLASPARTADVIVTIVGISGQTIVTTNSYVAGSLIRHIDDAFNAALTAAGYSTAANMNILAGDGSRNPSHWAAGLCDLSALVVGHSGGLPQGALVTPRHVLIANHVNVSIGSTYSFRNAANTATVTRTVAAKVNVAEDLMLVTLDADATGCTPAKVLPATVGSHWKVGTGWRAGLPLLKAKRVGGAHVLAYAQGNNTSAAHRAMSALQVSFYREWVSGDSGSAVGTAITGEYIFLGNAWTGQGGPGAYDDSASSVLANRAALDAALSGSGYSLSDVNLVGFPTF